MGIKFIRLVVISSIFIIVIPGCAQLPNYSISSSNEIAFIKFKFSNPKFGYEIWTMNYDGKNQQLLLKDKHHLCGALSWSPEGKRIVFSYSSTPKKFIPEVTLSESTKGMVSELEMIDLVKKKRIKLLKKEGFLVPISWPNKEKIILKWSRGGKNGVYSFNIAQDKFQKFVDDNLIKGKSICNPWLSPDGKDIVFQARYESFRYKVYIMNLKEKKIRRLTNNPSEACEMSPVWLPDNNWIAFEELNPKVKKPKGTTIVLINPKTKQRHEILIPSDERIGLISPMRFSPNGKKIIFATGAFSDIYTIDIDGKNLKNLTNTPDWDETSPSWRPIVKK